jgi:hypothetical protein
MISQNFNFISRSREPIIISIVFPSVWPEILRLERATEEESPRQKLLVRSIELQSIRRSSNQHDNDNIDADDLYSRCRYVLFFLNSANAQLLGLEDWEGFEKVGRLLVHGRELEVAILDLEYHQHDLAEEG